MKYKYNILFIFPSIFNPLNGGVERVSDYLIKSFRLLGHNVYSLHYNQNCSDEYKDEFTFFLPNNRLYSTENVNFFIDLQRELGVDIIICQKSLFEDVYFFSDNCLKNIKKIAVFHSDLNCIEKEFLSNVSFSHINLKEIIINLKTYAGIRYRRYIHYLNIIRKFDKIIFLNNNSKNKFALRYPFTSEKLEVINNPVKINMAHNQKQNIVLFVGRFAKEKCVERLIRIWKAIYQDIPDWKLVLIGYGPEQNKCKQIAINENLQRIYFKDKLNPMYYYSISSIFCLTSTYEGWPMTLLEALSYETVPILFNSFSSAKEIINNNGILVKPFNEKAYAKELKNLIINNSYRESLKNNAINSIKDFNIDNIANKWCSVFDALMK
ncbi:MAG: glycosyltransferase [Bacteroidales bacterium]|nr:glycosyltransferase [Bacteroidales bacterium]